MVTRVGIAEVRDKSGLNIGRFELMIVNDRTVLKCFEYFLCKSICLLCFFFFFFWKTKRRGTRYNSYEHYQTYSLQGRKFGFLSYDPIVEERKIRHALFIALIKLLKNSQRTKSRCYELNLRNFVSNATLRTSDITKDRVN